MGGEKNDWWGPLEGRRVLPPLFLIESAEKTLINALPSCRHDADPLGLVGPALIASGFLYKGSDYPHLEKGGWGGLITKGLTEEERLGNPVHRLAETKSGLINSIGLANPGAKAFCHTILPTLLALGKPIVSNLSGFSVKGYGKLAHIDFKTLKVGARVKQDEYEKGEAQDFALWKAWSEEDGKVFWETELGKGRPGWHIECSAMSMKHLGESLDIHGGGEDLIFPHHENEIAQSEAATGKPFSRFWIHNAFLKVNDEKMSKSLGNFYTLRDLNDYNPISVRYLMISSQYRQPLNFTFESLRAAQNSLDRINELVGKLKDAEGKDSGETKKAVEEAKKKFETAMDDDLNTPLALAAVFEFVRECNSLIDKESVGKKDGKAALEFLKKVDSVLGVMDFEQENKTSEEDLKLIKEREKLREEKKWAEADKIRDKLTERGILLDDTAKGTKWKKV